MSSGSLKALQPPTIPLSNSDPRTVPPGLQCCWMRRKARLHAWPSDALTRGDFRGARPSGVQGQSGVFLLIDVNGNGKIDPRGETFDAMQPFNIGGVTYEARDIDAAGFGIEIVKSARTVPEI